MSPKEHVIYGATASAAVYPFWGLFGAVSFFLGSVFIDIDHYLDYLYFSRFRNWSVKDMFAFHGQMARWKDRNDFLALEAFHTAEFLLAFLAVGLYFKSAPLLLFFSGMIFHLGLDLFRLHSFGRVPVRAISFIEYWVRARRMRRSGIDPEGLFRQAYEKITAKTRD